MIFNCKNVCTEWRDALDLKKCFVADNLSELKAKVMQDQPENIVIVRKGNDITPFYVENLGLFKYAYIIEYDRSNYLTNKEMSEWLSKGNGEIKIVLDDQSICQSWLGYIEYGANEKLMENMFARKWKDTEWHFPTYEYCLKESKK